MSTSRATQSSRLRTQSGIRANPSLVRTTLSIVRAMPSVDFLTLSVDLATPSVVREERSRRFLTLRVVRAMLNAVWLNVSKCVPPARSIAWVILVIVRRQEATLMLISVHWVLIGQYC